MAEPTDTQPYTSGAPVSVDVEYTTRDLLLYALGVGSRDPRYVYELDPAFAAFPTYPIVLTYKGSSYDALPFPPPAMQAFPMPPLKGVRVGLDAEKLIEKVAELPKEGARLRLVGRVVGIHQKKSGALVEKAYELVDASGKVYYRMVDGGYLVGAKGFRDSGRSYSENIPPPTGPPTTVVETPVEEHITALYRLSGDYNPLHIDPEFARAAGFERPIVHGLCTLGHTTRALLDSTVGGDQRRFKSVQLRFSSPVLPGQTIITEMWRKTPTEYIFQVKVKETGKVCVSNGRFLLTPEPKL